MGAFQLHEKEWCIMDFLKSLGIKDLNAGTSTGRTWLTAEDQGVLRVVSPVDGQLGANVRQASELNYETMITTAQTAFHQWCMRPAPQRGEIVRQIGEQLRAHKDSLGRLVTWEMGKSLQEGWGEVQEMIDICDFAVGLSRQLYGYTMHFFNE